MSTRVTILGCGHSGGTPLIGNEWGACDPAEPRNRRSRPSIYVQHGEKGLVIDTGPDFRNQINLNNIKKIDAVLYTHYHMDHTLGIDDLRVWCLRRGLKMPIYGTSETFAEMRENYRYQFEQKSEFYPTVFQPHELSPADLYAPLHLAGIPLTIFEQDHKTCTSLGIRIGNFAYSTDLVDLGMRSIDVLRGIDTWVLDCARYSEPATVHGNLDMVFRLNRAVGAKMVYLTHMPPTMDYRTLLSELPDGYAPAYDGLQIDVSV
jgi:phosphoribosyl 1,2-cyclic phosphate phosphodiesterase